MTTEIEKPFWQRPLPPIQRPGATTVVAAVEPPDAPAIVDEELPSPPAAMGDGARASNGVSAPSLEARPAAQIPPHEVLRNAAHNLDIARWRARECRSAVSASREAFNLALGAWNRTLPIQNVEDLKKEWIASNQEERRRKAEAGQMRRPMSVTETARAMSGGNRRAGGGAAYKRNGTFTRAEAAKIEMNRAAANRLQAAAAAARKLLPSER